MQLSLVREVRSIIVGVPCGALICCATLLKAETPHEAHVIVPNWQVITTFESALRNRHSPLTIPSDRVRCPVQQLLAPSRSWGSQLRELLPGWRTCQKLPLGCMIGRECSVAEDGTPGRVRLLCGATSFGAVVDGRMIT